MLSATLLPRALPIVLLVVSPLAEKKALWELEVGSWEFGVDGVVP